MRKTEAARIKTRVGKVISRRPKTVVVSVERQVRHPLFGKRIQRSTNIHAHDEKEMCQVGDRVKISETRPISKMKSWRVDSIIEKAK